jgi:hypothetical protein
MIVYLAGIDHENSSFAGVIEAQRMAAQLGAIGARVRLTVRSS